MKYHKIINNRIAIIAQHTLALNFLPTKRVNIVRGFQDHSIRPVGYGNLGNWLGAVRPVPTFFFSASALGNI